MYVIVNSQKDNGKALKEHILKDIVPRAFDAIIEEIKEEHRQTIQKWDNQSRTIQYDNVGLQGEIQAKDQDIAVLQRCCERYRVNEEKKNGMSIIAKINEQQSIPIYLYADSIAMEGTKLECC